MAGANVSILQMFSPKTAKESAFLTQNKAEKVTPEFTNTNNIFLLPTMPPQGHHKAT
jgi:hypothetical protein